MMPKTPPTVATTPDFLALVVDSQNRNRGPIGEIADVIDPDGIHVVTMQMPHNGVEWRCQWLVKVRGTMEPLTIWMDNGFNAFELNTQPGPPLRTTEVNDG